MLLFLLPVLALLLGAEARLSAGTGDKWPSAAAQHGKDRSWNRFRDVSLHGERGWGGEGGGDGDAQHISPLGQVIIGLNIRARARGHLEREHP